MKSTEQQIAEDLSDPTVPRRGVYGINKSMLTDEERARLVVVDPYRNDRDKRLASVGETIRLAALTGKGQVVQMPCGTREQQERISRAVEDGQLAFISVRPEWFTRSGRLRPHNPGVLADPMAGSVGPEHMMAHHAQLASARRAQEAFHAAHGAPSSVPESRPGLAYRPPSAQR